MGLNSKSGMIKHSAREGSSKSESTAVGGMKSSLKPGNKGGGVKAGVVASGSSQVKKSIPSVKVKGVKVDDHKKEINMADQCSKVYHNEDGDGDAD